MSSNFPNIFWFSFLLLFYFVRTKRFYEPFDTNYVYLCVKSLKSSQFPHQNISHFLVAGACLDHTKVGGALLLGIVDSASIDTLVISHLVVALSVKQQESLSWT